MNPTCHPGPGSIPRRLLLLSACAGLATALIAQTVPASAVADPTASQPTVELSPFMVSAESDVGWLATASLAGSRLNTPLRDTGASISVLTAEFLKDLGAIDLEDAVGYAVNIHLDTNEGTNVNDNWSMTGSDASRMRIRGVAATVTRNYFRWGIQSDSYNADRIEENRGPNSILFGIGSAGGVVNTLTKQANLSRDFRRASIVVGSFDSYRGTVDVNQRVLDGKLALRLNAVHSEQGSYREHSFNDTDRVHLAATWQVRDRSRLRADFEIGRVENLGSRPAPAFDGIGSWKAAGERTFDTPQTSNLGSLGVTRYNAGQRRLTYVENLGEVYNFQGQNRSSGNGDVILDESIISYTANPVGPYNRRDADFHNLSFFWEEQLFERTFLELSHNRQVQERENFILGQGRTENGTLYADPMNRLPDGSVNPYAGAQFFEGGRWNRNENRLESNNTRLMISHELDAGRWGNYRLAAMGEIERREERNRIDVEVWEGAPFNSNPENDQNQVWRRYYVTPGDWATYHAGSGPRAGFLRDIPDPTTPGRLLNSTWVPFNQNQLDSIEDQKTLLLGGHARYFRDRLVLGAGFRKDELKIRLKNAERDPATNVWSVDHPGVEYNRERYEGTTRTLGAVYHATPNISLFYNFSNSIDIPNTSHRILPDGRIPPASEAEGQDFGLGFSFFEGRLAARINRFEVDMIGATGGGFGGSLDNPTTLNNRVLTALLGAGVIDQATVDAREFSTNQATIDRRLEGYEFNLTGAITRNWRIQVGYSYTDGFDSNIAPEVKAWAAEALPWYRQWPDVVTAVEGANGQFLTVDQLVAQWEADVQRLRWVREGDLILGNRKHKYSVFTRYSFEGGALDGLYVGGGYRHQSPAPLGFNDDEELQWSDSQGEADALLGYRFARGVLFFKKGLSLQLNIRNLLDEREPRVTTLRPDGVRVQRALIVTPRTWRLTASFDF